MSETGRVIVPEGTIERSPPINAGRLATDLRDLFSRVRVQKYPAVVAYELHDVYLDEQACVFRGGRLWLRHMEFSERRMQCIRVPSFPLLTDFLFGPRRALGVLRRWFVSRHRRRLQMRKARRIDEHAVVFWDARATSNIYHWFIDAVPRLLAHADSNSSARLVVPKRFFRRQYVQDSLARLGVDAATIVTYGQDEMLWCRRLTLVGPAIQATGACNAPLVNRAHRLFCLAATAGRKRYYIGRKAADGRKILNQQAFEQLLGEYEVQTFYAEDLTFDQLLSLLAQASMLIAVYGAALAHALFMPKHATMIEIAPSGFLGPTPAYWKNRYEAAISGDYYYSLSSSLGQRYAVVPASRLHTTDVLSADVEIDLPLLRDAIATAIVASEHET